LLKPQQQQKEQHSYLSGQNQRAAVLLPSIRSEGENNKKKGKVTEEEKEGESTCKPIHLGEQQPEVAPAVF